MDARRAWTLKIARDLFLSYEDGVTMGDTQLVEDELRKLGALRDPDMPFHLVAGLLSVCHYLATAAAGPDGDLPSVLRELDRRVDADTR